jgi:hypothetical protein
VKTIYKCLHMKSNFPSKLQWLTEMTHNLLTADNIIGLNIICLAMLN